ncbi:unnamed protein product, partial [Polarella glacialis]
VASPRSSASLSQTQWREAKRARIAAEKVHGEVLELWSCRSASAAMRRRTQVDEWYLGQLRGQLQDLAQGLRSRVQQLKEVQVKFDEAESQRQDLAIARAKGHEELERNRQELVELHQQALGIREACIVPAQLKKKSTVLMKFLDQ